MLSITLVRHGETKWNAEQRCQGVVDIPLNATGQAQAEATAEALRGQPADAIYASDLSRAMDTAQAIAAHHGVPVQSRSALREMHQGALEGLTFVDMRRQYPELIERWITDPEHLVMPGGGESLQQVQDRAWPALQEIVGAHEDGCIVVVTHTIVMRCLIARVLQLPLAHCRRFHIDTASLTELEVNGRFPGFALRTLNNTTHLHALAGRTE